MGAEQRAGGPASLDSLADDEGRLLWAQSRKLVGLLG